MCGCDFHRAMDDADFLLKSVFGYTYIAKALDPTKDEDFILITQRLRREFSEHAGPIEARFVSDAINRLDVDWVNMTPAQQSEVVRASNLALRGMPEQVLPGISTRMSSTMSEVIGETKVAVSDKWRFGISTSLDAQDAEVVRRAATAQSTYATDVYGKRRLDFDGEARAIVADGMAEGLRSAEIAANLASAAERIHLSKSDDYWQVVSSSASNRARTYGQMRSFDEARITTYRFSAVLDQKTTNICRMMHDRVFSVNEGLDLTMAADDDGAEVKETQPWVRERKNSDGKTELFTRTSRGDSVVATVEQSGVGRLDDTGSYSGVMSQSGLAGEGIMLPPLHGLCRSSVLPIV